MKVKDMIKELSFFNPEAEVNVVVASRPLPFGICFGGSEGCTKSNCGGVYLMVSPNSERER